MNAEPPDGIKKELTASSSETSMDSDSSVDESRKSRRLERRKRRKERREKRRAKKLLKLNKRANDDETKPLEAAKRTMYRLRDDMLCEADADDDDDDDDVQILSDSPLQEDDVDTDDVLILEDDRDSIGGDPSLFEHSPLAKWSLSGIEEGIDGLSYAVGNESAWKKSATTSIAAMTLMSDDLEGQLYEIGLLSDYPPEMPPMCTNTGAFFYFVKKSFPHSSILNDAFGPWSGTTPSGKRVGAKVRRNGVRVNNGAVVIDDLSSTILYTYIATCARAPRLQKRVMYLEESGVSSSIYIVSFMYSEPGPPIEVAPHGNRRSQGGAHHRLIGAEKEKAEEALRQAHGSVKAATRQMNNEGSSLLTTQMQHAKRGLGMSGTRGRVPRTDVDALDAMLRDGHFVQRLIQDRGNFIYMCYLPESMKRFLSTLPTAEEVKQFNSEITDWVKWLKQQPQEALDHAVQMMEKTRARPGTLMVDVTFNLCHFYVIPVVYLSNMFEDRASGKPRWLNLMYILSTDHKSDTTRVAFEHLSAEIMRVDPEKRIRSVITDQEVSVSRIIESKLGEDAVNVHCFTHTFFNLQRAVGLVDAPLVYGILFGQVKDGVKTAGVVDTATTAQEVIEKAIEEGAICAKDWLVANATRLVEHCGIVTRLRAGIGLTNASTNPLERFNGELKKFDVVGSRKLPVDGAVRELQKFVEGERDECVHAVRGAGPMMLREGLNEVRPDVWSGMDGNARRKALKPFCLDESFKEKISFPFDMPEEAYGARTGALRAAYVEEALGLTVHDAPGGSSSNVAKFFVEDSSKCVIIEWKKTKEATCRGGVCQAFCVHMSALCAHLDDDNRKILIKDVQESKLSRREAMNAAFSKKSGVKGRRGGDESVGNYSRAVSSVRMRPAVDKEKEKQAGEMKDYCTAVPTPTQLAMVAAQRYSPSLMTRPFHNTNGFVITLRTCMSGRLLSFLCQACKNSFPQATPTTPSSITDLAIVHKERVAYMDKHDQKFKYTDLPHDRPYHCSLSCLLKRYPYYVNGLLSIDRTSYLQMAEIHKERIHAVFGVTAEELFSRIAD